MQEPVLDPDSAAQQFIDEYDQPGLAHAEDGEPILYVVEEDFHPRSMDNVASIKSQTDSLDGEIVETTVRLYQERISVQETLEHNTGCGEDLLEIQTPEGSACVNVVQDTLLHGGVAWNSLPQSRDGVLLVLGASSWHQDSPEEFTEGRYRIVGEVISTSRFNESLSDGAILVIYELNRVDEIDYEAVAQEARAIIETRASEVTTRLRQQLGAEGVEITTDRATQTIQTAAPSEPATVTFSQPKRGPVAVQQAQVTVSTEIQNLQVEVADVASLPSGVSRPPGQSLHLLNISTTAAESSITNASFHLRIATAALPDGANVTVYRYHDQAWNALATRVVEQSASSVVIEVKTPGFSYFAVSIQAADEQAASDAAHDESPTERKTSSRDEDQPTEGATGSQDEGTPEPTETSTPGFTIVSVLVALLVVVGWRRRK